MTIAAARLVCAGCGAAPSRDEPYPFRCPSADGDDIDHVLVRLLDERSLDFPASPPVDARPFVHYRRLLHSYHRAEAAGMTDAAFVALVTELDAAIASVDGHGFHVTPFARSESLSAMLGFAATGGVWVKDETNNVAGSHKGRHLMGVLLHLEIAARAGLVPHDAVPRLAVASCGNAALAAAVLARAADRPLDVFVPVGADPAILQRLDDLGADVVVCERARGTAGDPTLTGLRAAVAAGEIPFTCQGSENGLVIEGGETLAYEIVSTLVETQSTLDHLVVQVGGGALASACVQALDEAVAFGVLPRRPRIHTVQTTGAHPLERAYRKIDERLATPATPDAIDAALHAAAQHRSAFMWPWEHEPHSIATGILDDETYDWHAVVGGMLGTGGLPVVASEQRLAEAHRLGRSAGFAVEPTGTAGLAGVMVLLEEGVIRRDDRVAVLFTGVDRTAS